MSGAVPARRLLARLIDEQAIETEPIAEVRADLAALGVDPARSIAVSRSLAANADSPAASLLRRVSESEAGDDEIRRLEMADIGAVRHGLPEGVVAATAARARRAAGIDSNVVGVRHRRSRRLLYALGGVAAALAASLVFYVGVSTNEPFQPTPPREAPEAPIASRSVTPPSGQGLQAANQPASGVSSGRTVASEAATPPPRSDEQRSAAAEAADAERQKLSELEALARYRQEQAPTTDQDQTAGIVAGAAGSEAKSAAAPKAREEVGDSKVLRKAVSAAPPAAPFGLMHPVLALLIVDPGLMPQGLRQEDYPVGELPARLGDARRRAEGRAVAALVTLRVGDRVVDAVISRSEDLTDGGNPLEAEPPTDLGPVAPGYALVELERR
jgi:hypothetical protein